ncbi:hypothetical protein ON010_g8611 [Phytophthora cinnamomi]|nr:hypothetical protein ON010_g8611 [Phytophthora cinnamomi]
MSVCNIPRSQRHREQLHQRSGPEPLGVQHLERRKDEARSTGGTAESDQPFVMRAGLSAVADVRWMITCKAWTMVKHNRWDLLLPRVLHGALGVVVGEPQRDAGRC